MSEVSCRSLVLFFETLSRAGIPPERLADGTGFTLAQLREPRRRIPWDIYAEMTDRLGVLLGGEDALVRMGRGFHELDSYRRLGQLIGLATTPRQVYEISLRMLHRWMFFGLVCEFEMQDEHTLRVTLHLPEPYRTSSGFFSVIEGTLAAYPVFRGQPHADVTHERASARESRYLVRINGEWGGRGVGLRSRLAMLRAALRPGTFLDNLTAQNEETSALLRALHAERRRLQRSQAELVDKVAELERLGDELTRSEALYRSLAESAPDVVLRIDPDGVVRFVNRAGVQARADLLGRPLLALVPDDQHPLVAARLDAVLRRGERAQYLTSYGDGSGGRLQFAARMAPIEQDGAIVGATLIARDVTQEQKDAEERVELVRQVLHAQKLESLGLLAGGIAHDFNNLLTGIQANVELLLREQGDEEERRRRLHRIGRAASRAADLTNRILAYSGRAPNVVRPFDLSTLVEDLGELLAAALPKNVRLELVLTPDLPAVEGDAVQVQQVVMNLITNAAEAMEGRDGVVRVATRVASKGQEPASDSVVAEVQRPGPFVLLEVADEGPGVPASARQQMFDPFFSTKGQGRGLGLSTVIGVVRGHGGALEVEDAPGGGAMFRVWLPSCEAEDLEAPDVISSDPGQGGGRVLIVDDEEILRQTAVDLLEGYGFQAVAAADGHEALGLLAAEAGRFDIVLLDWSMPGMSGADVFGALRDRWPELPVVLCSAYDLHEELDALWPRGLAAFVRKPYTGRELARVLQARIG